MAEVTTVQVAVIGGGPAGLMAAEALLGRGCEVHLSDGMPALARKLMVAGQSNLSLTRDQPFEELLAKYGAAAPWLRPALEQCTPDHLRQWAAELGIETFVGSTGQVFPVELSSDQLVSRWLDRLTQQGLVVHPRHLWQGWDEESALLFQVDGEMVRVAAQATVLALGGGSWPQLGSSGEWLTLLRARGVAVTPLQPANCGFDADFTDHFRDHFQGQPVKNVVLTLEEGGEVLFRQRGEFIVTATGFEGSLLYQCGPELRRQFAEKGQAVLHLDLCPDRSLPQLIEALSQPRNKRSTSSHLRKTVAIDGVKAGLLNEWADRSEFTDPEKLAHWLKNLPVPLTKPRPLAEAISSSGGVSASNLDQRLMVREIPGLFCAGEMLDWEAPTGGYLLTACFATGKAAGIGAADWLDEQGRDR